MTEPRIMFVTRKWAPAVGGMETYSMRLTDAMNRIEPVQVIALSGRSDGMPPRMPALLLFPWRVLIECLRRREAPKVLHLADMAIWPLALIAILFGGRTKIALSAHGTDIAYHRRGGLKGSLYGIYLRLGARVLKHATLIANSRATADVAKETGWTTATVISLATDLSGPEPDGTHNGRMLFVGRLVERKGFGWFVREVLPRLPNNIRLDVAGTGWDDAERVALDHPRVRFLGSLRGRQLIDAYRQALCVVVPNIHTASGEYEGFGLVAPEAAACGGIVLAADCGGLRDAVIDGVTGILLPAGDAERWAEQAAHIHSWTVAQRQQFTRRAAQQAQEAYSWKRVADQTHFALIAGSISEIQTSI